ncbi:pre-mRNA-processing factor 39-2 isoform X2 [Humulus lupulus]|uniref:pre-mRNA-processing factor 39-2 isoform X2 n=1 Tax=Humulus lupulus TaxID=3486 RepID=UPI002B40F6CB|nr:pre-mRNA-processing factor 39-2 isoform X2 [Humulus lupulus]
MEAQISVSETELHPETMDFDSPATFDELNLHEVINKGSLDFDEWISLIKKIEKVYPDNIEKICLVYDSFLSEFPLCHGYWRRYADHKARLCDVDEVVEVFERAVQSATYSVGVWVDYCNFSMLAFEDPSDIRRLFRRGMSYVGKDYLCHALWDKYIEFELSQQQWSLLAQIYIEALRFPTKKLHRYYDSFKKLANLCTKELGCETVDSWSGSSAEDEVPKSYRADAISSVIKDLLEPSISLTRSKALLQKYLYIGEHLYQEACQVEEKISTFEMNIRRSYFHVKFLDVDQLENWHHYLDFVGMQRDFDWAVKLYERCLIPCANYPEFWMRYAEFMETKGGREIATYALNRATQIFLKRVPAMHLFNARFKEREGDIIGARTALLHCDGESDSNFVENVVRKANMEKRLGNFVAATNMYEEALAMAELKKMMNTLPILYVHFSRLKYMITDNADAARDILIEGIKRLPNCRLLLEELINFATLHGGQRHIHVVDSVIANVISPGSDVSQGWNAKDAEHASSLYLKFVDSCGTIDEVRKAWNRHVRLFPDSFRTAFYEQLTTHEKSLQLDKEGREINIVTKHQQPPGDSNPGSLVRMPLQDKEMSLLENSGTSKSDQDSSNLNISEQKLVAHEIHDIQFKQTPTSNQFPLEEADRGSGEKVMLPARKVTEQSKKDSPETNVSSVELVSFPKQPTEDATTELNAPSSSLKQEVAEETDSLRTLNEYSTGNDHKQDYDREPQRDMQPLSLESLSLHNQGKPSSDSKKIVSPAFEAPQETCISNEIMVESNQLNNDEDHLTHSQRKAEDYSPQIENEVVNPLSSRSHQNPTSTKPRYQQSRPANSGGNWHRINNYGKVRRESKFGFRGHLQKSHQHKQGSTQHHPRAELSGPIPISQGIPSQSASPQTQQIPQGSQSQIQFQTIPPPNIPPPPLPPATWPVQNMPQPNYASSPQPVQGSGEQEMQNSQAYNQMWQYYYYQQQMLMQQQPQQQHLHMSQEYQQQYTQWQQQQYLYQQQLQQHPPPQQQLPQQPHQLYMHQVPQQPQQEQARQDQQQQQNTPSNIQEWNHNNYQQDMSLELDGSNQSGAEPTATHNIASHEDQAMPPLHTSTARETSENVKSLNSNEQSPAKQ